MFKENRPLLWSWGMKKAPDFWNVMKIPINEMLRNTLCDSQRTNYS